MEEHLRKISNICRLCRKKINTNPSYTESNVETCIQLKNKILMLFSHDVTDDNPLQHPTRLCHNCSVKLNKVEYDGQYLSATIAEFEVHDDSCTLCRLHRLKEHKFPMKQAKKFDLDTLVDIAKENGFILLELLSKKIAKIALLNQDNVVTFLLSVKQDFSWTLMIYQREITQGSFFQSLPSILTADNIESMLQDLKEAKICIGNNDFHELVDYKVEGFESFLPTGNLEDQQLNIMTTNSLIIRASNCDVVLSKNHGPTRCDSCTKHRKALLKVNRKLPSIISSAVKKKRPHSTMNKKQLKRKLFDSSIEIKELQRQKRVLEKKLTQSTKEKGRYEYFWILSGSLILWIL